MSQKLSMTPLTIMSDVNGSTRRENGENTGVVKASGVSGTVVDLEAETEGMSAGVWQATRMIYHGAVKPWAARASGVGDDEGVFGKGVQDSTGVVEEFEGLVTGIDDGRCDLQVLQSVDIDVGG